MGVSKTVPKKDKISLFNNIDTLISAPVITYSEPAKLEINHL